MPHGVPPKKVLEPARATFRLGPIFLHESEELVKRQALLVSAMKGLNERERRIFTARRLSDDPLTLEELSSEFGVSRERIRQIEVRAFEKVQKAVQRAAIKAETPRASTGASAPALSAAR